MLVWVWGLVVERGRGPNEGGVWKNFGDQLGRGSEINNH